MRRYLRREQARVSEERKARAQGLLRREFKLFYCSKSAPPASEGHLPPFCAVQRGWGARREGGVPSSSRGRRTCASLPGPQRWASQSRASGVTAVADYYCVQGSAKAVANIRKVHMKPPAASISTSARSGSQAVARNRLAAAGEWRRKWTTPHLHVAHVQVSLMHVHTTSPADRSDTRVLLSLSLSLVSAGRSTTLSRSTRKRIRTRNPRARRSGRGQQRGTVQGVVHLDPPPPISARPRVESQRYSGVSTAQTHRNEYARRDHLKSNSDGSPQRGGR